MIILVGLSVDDTITGFYPVGIEYNEEDLPRRSIKITSELHMQLLDRNLRFVSDGDNKEIYDIWDEHLFHDISQQTIELPRSKVEIDLERITQENIQLKERLTLVEQAMNDLLFF